MAVEDCNCMSLRRAARRVSNFYDAVLSPSGVRATQYSMLALLGEVGALSINDLVTTRLVKIARSSADRRSRVASLTERGADTLRRARPLWRQAQEQFERANGKGLARDLRAMLRSIRVQR
jgi:hypothetical protein